MPIRQLQCFVPISRLEHQRRPHRVATKRSQPSVVNQAGHCGGAGWGLWHPPIPQHSGRITRTRPSPRATLRQRVWRILVPSVQLGWLLP